MPLYPEKDFHLIKCVDLIGRVWTERDFMHMGFKGCYGFLSWGVISCIGTVPQHVEIFCLHTDSVFLTQRTVRVPIDAFKAWMDVCFLSLWADVCIICIIYCLVWQEWVREVLWLYWWIDGFVLVESLYNSFAFLL